ncbi:MAG TPA: APC family permease [Pseudonocardiaceae bacterium]
MTTESDPRAATGGDDASLAEFGYQQELRRSLRLRDLLVYGMIFMVPIAPFAIFGVVFNTSRGMVPLTYLIGLVAMLFTALSYREMSRAFPVAGSVYTYAGRGITSWVGFLAGWAILLDYLLVPTLLYVTGAAALETVLPGVPQWLWVVIFVVLNTTVNLAGVEITAQANRLFLLGELIVLAIFVVFALIAVVKGTGGAHWSVTPLFNKAEFSPSLVFAALSVAVLSFLGFDAISTQSEEVQGGPKVVGRATVLSLCLVAVVSLILGLFFVGQIAFLSTLVNFGALFAFLLLHVSVGVYYLIKRRQRTFGMHLVVPLIGFVIIGYVLYNADTHAKIGGSIWLAIGIAVIVVRKLTGRDVTLNLDENARA